MQLMLCSVQAYLPFAHPLQVLEDVKDAFVLFENMHKDKDVESILISEKKVVPKQHRPMVKAYFETFWRNLVFLFTNPSWEAIVAFSADGFAFMFMPLVGGFLWPESHNKFVRNESAFKDEGVSEKYLFETSGSMFKEGYWEFTGLFSRLGVMESLTKNNYQKSA